MDLFHPSASAVQIPQLAMIAGGLLLVTCVAAHGAPASGPLRIHATNPRYFADPSGKPVYLTGSHMWNNLQDMGETDPPSLFDWDGYLDFLDRHHHNFVRLWRWELTRWDTSTTRIKPSRAHFVAPHPWPRTGPGNALDGKPKFDLTQFDDTYFTRLRTRVQSAGKRGIYVSVMLFEGWGLQRVPSGWKAHPFHPDNNVNGTGSEVGGDGKGLAIHTLTHPAITEVQEAYVRKVIDTINDLDNVLYEISNENHPASTEWQYHLIRFIKDVERGKPKQHPVGMTFQFKGGSNRALFDSPADWVSPNPTGGYRDNPPDPKNRVILSDTDHLWGIGGNQSWVWKTFLRGMNPIFMDPYDGLVLGKPFDWQWDPIRRSMGHARRLAERVDLAAMAPKRSLASSKYCLAQKGVEYIVYVPTGGKVTVDLSDAPGMLSAEWINPTTGQVLKPTSVPGGAKRAFSAPFEGDAVIHVSRAKDVQGSDMKPTPNADRIQPWPTDPRYWQYRGQPVLLIGGSREDNLFQIPDLEQHLDLLASVGGNVIRNTMSDRDEGNVYAFKRLGKGKYDLSQWNGEYWRRFETMLRLTAERDIIVQIEVWDRFDYTDAKGLGLWQRSPWNPKNNVNYTYEQSGFAESYPDHPARDRHPFFHSLPGMGRYRKRYDAIRRYQERFVDKMLSHSLDYGQVLYCMNNETSTPVKWGQYWMQFIRRRAKEQGVLVFATDMFDNVWKPERSGKLRLAISQPAMYPFIDMSQVNSRNFGEDHWRRACWIVQRTAKSPRPLNNTKIYSAGQTSFGSGTPKEGVERFWRNLIAGAASGRFHRPTSGIGLNKISQACIRAARKVETIVKFWDVEPHLELLCDRASNAAYLAAKPSDQYVLFLTEGGPVSLDLKAANGSFSGKWVNVKTGEWSRPIRLQGGAVVPIKAPGKGPWIAAFAKER